MSEGAKLLTVPELAQLLDISSRGVYRLVEARKIPFVRVGRQLRFDPDRVVTALEFGGERVS